MTKCLKLKDKIDVLSLKNFVLNSLELRDLVYKLDNNLLCTKLEGDKWAWYIRTYVSHTHDYCNGSYDCDGLLDAKIVRNEDSIRGVISKFREYTERVRTIMSEEQLEIRSEIIKLFVKSIGENLSQEDNNSTDDNSGN